MPAFNAEFTRPARVEGSAFARMSQPEARDDILFELHEQVVGKDNCVSVEERVLQLQPTRGRPHYMRVWVKVRRHMDGSVSVWHGPRLRRRYDADGHPRRANPARQSGQIKNSKTGHFYLLLTAIDRGWEVDGM